jgi:hypothetical protein
MSARDPPGVRDTGGWVAAEARPNCVGGSCVDEECGDLEIGGGGGTRLGGRVEVRSSSVCERCDGDGESSSPGVRGETGVVSTSSTEGSPSVCLVDALSGVDSGSAASEDACATGDSAALAVVDSVWSGDSDAVEG